MVEGAASAAGQAAGSDRDPEPLIGQVLGERYEVLYKIAAGGTSAVYAARHRLIGRDVAIKVLHARLARDPEAARRLLDEARLVGGLGHPHIVAALDAGVTPAGNPFLAFELLKGSPLSDEISARGRLEVQRAARIARQVAWALQAAHDQGVVHRDLKPENIILVDRADGADHAKVVDFGLAEALDWIRGVADGTQGAIAGTPAYMAPEQICQPRMVDARTDIYALGVVLYQMLSGNTPFGDRPARDILWRIVEEEPAPLPSLVPDLPTTLAEVVATAMSKAPERRFRSMEEVVDALRRFTVTSSNVTPGVIEDEVPARPGSRPPLPARPTPSAPPATPRAARPTAAPGPPEQATGRSPGGPPTPPSLDPLPLRGHSSAWSSVPSQPPGARTRPPSGPSQPAPGSRPPSAPSQRAASGRPPSGPSQPTATRNRPPSAPPLPPLEPLPPTGADVPALAAQPPSEPSLPPVRPSPGTSIPPRERANTSTPPRPPAPPVVPSMPPPPRAALPGTPSLPPSPWSQASGPPPAAVPMRGWLPAALLVAVLAAGGILAGRGLLRRGPPPGPVGANRPKVRAPSPAATAMPGDADPEVAERSRPQRGPPDAAAGPAAGAQPPPSPLAPTAPAGPGSSAGEAADRPLAAEVQLEISSSSPGAVAIVRGQQHPVPARISLRSGRDPELIEVTAPDHVAQRHWVVLDRDSRMVIELQRPAVTPKKR